jgi:glucokinase
MPKRYAIGVDLGGTNLRVALVSSAGKVLKKIKEPSAGDTPATLKRAVDSLIDEDVVGIGIGTAGLIDSVEMRIVQSPNLPSLDGFSFKRLDFDRPAVIENDANCAAIGEKWMGVGKGFRNFVLLTLGTGIGGGIVHNGDLLSMPAEVGHMSIDSGGPKCPCGNHGCLELYASARAITGAVTKALEQGEASILRDCCKGNIYKIIPEDIYAAAFEGDNLARGVLKTAGRHLGTGIANLINIMGPDAVILTGGLIGAWDIFIEEAIMETSRRAFKGLFKRIKIVPSALGGDDAGVIGAAGLILHGK